MTFAVANTGVPEPELRSFAATPSFFPVAVVVVAAAASDQSPAERLVSPTPASPNRLGTATAGSRVAESLPLSCVRFVGSLPAPLPPHNTRAADSERPEWWRREWW